MVNLKDWISVNLKWWIRRTLKMRGELEIRIDSIIRRINEEICPNKRKRVDMENEIYHDYIQFCNIPTIRGISGLTGFIISFVGFLVALTALFSLYIKNQIPFIKLIINNQWGSLLAALTLLFLVVSIYLLFKEHKRIDVKNKKYWEIWLKETGDEHRKKIPIIHKVLLFLALLMEGYIIALTIVSFISSEINLRTATYISLIAGLTVAFFLEQLGIDAGRSLYKLDIARSLNKRFRDKIEFKGKEITIKDLLKRINPSETEYFDSLPKMNFFRKYLKLIVSFMLFITIGILLFIQRTNIKFNIFSEETNPEVTYSAALLLLVMFVVMYVYTVWVGHRYSYASDYSEIAKFGLKNSSKVESHNRKLSELAQKNFSAFYNSVLQILEEISSSSNSPERTQEAKKAVKCLSSRGEYELFCNDSQNYHS